MDRARSNKSRMTACTDTASDVQIEAFWSVTQTTECQNRKGKLSMIRQFVLAAALTATLAAGAVAQGKGPNGGQIADVEGHPVEFVASGKEIIFYFTDHDGKPASMAGAKGRAVIQSGGKTTTVPLEPRDPNLLVGKIDAPLATGAKVVMTTRMADHPMQARFVSE